MKTNVFEKNRRSVRKRIHCCCDNISDAVIDKDDLHLKDVFHSRQDATKGKLVRTGPFRTTKMGHERDFRTCPAERLNCGDVRRNSRRVAHGIAIHGHVEINPEQNFPVFERFRFKDSKHH